MNNLGVRLSILAVVAVCALLYYREYRLCQLADDAFTLQRNDKYDEAIEKANEALAHDSTNPLGYYVRGWSRLKLMTISKKYKMADLTLCESDLKKAQQLTTNLKMKEYTKEALELIAEIRARESEL